MVDRVLVVVDVVNLFGVVKANFDGRKIDYEKYLLKVEKEEGDIYRAFAYGAYVSDEANGFINCLHNVGFEPKYIKAIYYNDKPDVKRTNRTMDIVVDILTFLDRIDTVVIGTLDNDLIPFIYYIKNKGVKVVLYSCNVRRDLREACDEFWHIDEEVLEAIRSEVSVTST